MHSFASYDLLDVLMACLFAAHFVGGTALILWFWVDSRREGRKRRHLLQRHARMQAHPRGFATVELLQVMLGIAVMFLLAFAMVAGFADSPRW